MSSRISQRVRRLRRPDVRCRPEACHHRHSDTTDGLPHGSLDTDLPHRTPGLDPDLEPEQPPPRTARVRIHLQRTPPAQSPGTSHSLSRATHIHHATSPAHPPGSPQTRPTRRNPPRVPASSLSCAADLSAPTVPSRSCSSPPATRTPRRSACTASAFSPSAGLLVIRPDRATSGARRCGGRRWGWCPVRAGSAAAGWRQCPARSPAPPDPPSGPWSPAVPAPYRGGR